ncbi:hypothetical protein M0R04_03840 [Candidatus Dojkabacteria bacterium]|nr:hypothetical protein [Candidatus Dojkabacteria bacterium]
MNLNATQPPLFELGSLTVSGTPTVFPEEISTSYVNQDETESEKNVMEYRANLLHVLGESGIVFVTTNGNYKIIQRIETGPKKRPLDELSFHVPNQEVGKEFRIRSSSMPKIIIDELPGRSKHKEINGDKEYCFNTLFYGFILATQMMGCKKFVIPKKTIDKAMKSDETWPMHESLLSRFHFVKTKRGGYELSDNLISDIYKLYTEIEKLKKTKDTSIKASRRRIYASIKPSQGLLP